MDPRDWSAFNLAADVNFSIALYLQVPDSCSHHLVLLIPLQEEFFQETVRKVQALYQFDCLRANKSTMAWGVEARVPFLDRHFLDVAMAIDPAEKMIDKSKGEGLLCCL